MRVTAHAAALVKRASVPTVSRETKGLREDLFGGYTNSCREDGIG